MTAEIEVIKQLLAGPVWDGNIISKDARDRLSRSGHIDQTHGWNFLAAKGVAWCAELGLLKP